MAEVNPARFILLIVLLFYLSNSPEPVQPSPYTQLHNEEIIEKEWAALDVLNSTHHGDFDPSRNRWLNITGFRGVEGYNWEVYKDVRERAYAQASYALGEQVGAALGDELPWDQRPAVYKNVTGVAHGDWKLSDIGRGVARKPLNVSTHQADGTYSLKEFDRNITIANGNILLNLNEADTSMTASNSSIRMIEAEVTVKDDTAFNIPWKMVLRGVHFIHSGHILLTTTSEKFAGIFAVPQLALTDHMFSLSRDLLDRSILRTIEDQSASLDFRSNPWTSLPDGTSDSIYSVPHCEYVMYLQQHSVNGEGAVADSIDFLETELRFPTGAPSQAVPAMSFSMTAFSPDCGFVIESGTPGGNPGLRGMKKESREVALRHVIEALAVIFVAQIFFLVRQMKETSTPSTRHRISYYTVSVLALGDGFMSMNLLWVGLLHPSLFYTTFATFFLGFASVLYLSVRYVLDIWSVQFTEQRRQQRQANNSTQPPQEPGSDAQRTVEDTNLLPAPVTATRGDTGATPIVLPSDQDVDSANNEQTNSPGEDDIEAQRRAVYTYFCLTMFVMFILSAFALLWPAVIRNTFMNMLVFVYLSCWIPQIHRNIIRNCRKALRWEFILGQSLLRFVPIYYVYAVDSNVLFSKTDMNMLFLYLGWMWMQIFALLCQEHIGPRFFVPKGWAPPAYDYHPILREDEEDMNLPIEATETADIDDPSEAMKKAGESKEKGKRVYDCTICAQDVEVPVVPAGSSPDSLATTLMARRTYMVTPCRHIFHKDCLEGWMRYRLQCPNCRETIPPL